RRGMSGHRRIKRRARTPKAVANCFMAVSIGTLRACFSSPERDGRTTTPDGRMERPEEGRAMAELNGGQLLARCLAGEGIRFVFGLPSPEIAPLLAGLEGHATRLVQERHEAGGPHLAEGLYKATGQVAAVVGNPGRGSANLLAGVITARHEGVPMLAITSQHRLRIVFSSPPPTVPAPGHAGHIRT